MYRNRKEPFHAMKSTLQCSVTRKLFPVLVGVSVLAVFIPHVGATIDTSLQMQLGNPSGATANATNHDHYLIQRTVEAFDYSDNLGEPNWASWDLTSSDVGTNGGSSFHTDTTLPSGFYEVTSTITPIRAMIAATCARPTIARTQPTTIGSCFTCRTWCPSRTT